MPIQSMTGFGRGEAASELYTITVEIKSVNARFKEMRFKMPSLFNSLELPLKKKLGDKFKRGTFDIYINYKRGESNSKFEDLDPKKVNQFLDKVSSMIEAKNLNLTVSPTDFLRSEFMVDQDLSQDEEMANLVVKAFDGALVALEESRVSEGRKLIQVIKDHRQSYEGFFSKVENLTDTFKQNVEEKLRKRIKEWSSEVKVEEPRFLQEVIFYLEKMDVHEEINRIVSHLKKLDEILDKKSEIGRQIDFLIQELNRETNTIGSKSNTKEISDSVVQMKVHLEKIREQGLNLE
jgi:uncharacterized protein (TIGR00255 family)